MIDYNVRAERMGWLPSAPQLKTNPMQVVKDATAAGMDAKDYAVRALKDGTLEMSCEDPDAPQNWPRNLFVWRSTCWVHQARAMSISASTCWAPKTACKARTSVATMRSRKK
jgi:nitrate reductase alpha subunit